MTRTDTPSPLDGNVGDAVETLAARAASVVEEFESLCASRGPLIEDIVGLLEHLVTENEHLRGAWQAADEQSRNYARKLDLFVAEAGELAMHHKRVVTLFSGVLDTMTARMRDQRSEDKRIESARALAFSRARFGIGEAAGNGGGLFREEETPEADVPQPRPPTTPDVAPDPDMVVRGDAELMQDLERIMTGFARPWDLNERGNPT